ncbi:MAG: 4Fe-4S binding protein [Clostridia bacterium]|nr:4Fe-4S binding protein [Clostridia bacterium]
MLKQDGIPSKEELSRVLPSEQRLAQGPVVIAECFQRIPCDPCARRCPRGAFSIGEDINDLPRWDAELCDGCGDCIALCPGMAIFGVDMTYSKDQALVSLPFEFVPRPKPGQMALGLDRGGRELGWFEVADVKCGGEGNKTYVIALKAPRELAMELRQIKAGGYR